jgi:hypothetical protein
MTSLRGFAISYTRFPVNTKGSALQYPKFEYLNPKQYQIFKQFNFGEYGWTFEISEFGSV